MLWCLISRGKIIFKPHKWWCFWKKKTQQKWKPTSPKCKDFNMSLLIVCILHPQTWSLLSLKLFQFPKIIWNTPTPGVFDKQSSFYREKQLCLRLRDRERQVVGERERKWEHICELYSMDTCKAPRRLSCNIQRNPVSVGLPSMHLSLETAGNFGLISLWC